MRENPFKKATKLHTKLRMALSGPSGSGKTYSALSIAKYLAEDGPIAVIDTEKERAKLYSDIFTFDHVALISYEPQNYIEMIKAAEQFGYKVLVIDSLSHCWFGKNGLLEFVDMKAASKTENKFTAWRYATPLYNQLIDTMLGCNMHLIVTMRSKTDYVMEEYNENNHRRSKIRKVGLQPVMRDGIEYEFDITGDMDMENNLIVDKTRCSELRGKVFHEPGQDIATIVLNWLKEEKLSNNLVNDEHLQQSELDSSNRNTLIKEIKELIPQAHTTMAKLLDQIMRVFHKSSIDELTTAEINSVAEGLRNEANSCSSLKFLIGEALKEEATHSSQPIRELDLSGKPKKELKAIHENLENRLIDLRKQPAVA